MSLRQNDGLTRVLLISLLVFAVAPSGLAQVNTGTIRGLITDQSGAVIANAKIVVEDQNTNQRVETKTSGDGQYAVPFLKPGLYSVSAEASGFATSKRDAITLQVQDTLQIDLRLAVSGTSQQVEVTTAATPVLQTASSEVGQVVTESTIESLPLNGRNFSQLALLAPGTTPGPVGGIRTQGSGNETQRAGAEITANGGRGSFTNFMIDGLDDRDQSVGTVKVFPLVEGIQEFKVETSNYSAEFAGGGAVVNVTSRGGSNDFHGSAFEFLRNSDLDARQFFDSQRPPFHQNQFGVAIGGPIKKSKTFFFGDYQGLRIHQAQTALATVPTSLERSGNFTETGETIYDPNTYNSATGARQAFRGNIIPSDRFDPTAQNLLALFPTPNLPGLGNNFQFTPLRTITQDQFDIRIDHTISTTDSFFARATYGRADVRWPSTPPLINGALNSAAYLTGAGSIAGFMTNNTAPSGQGTWQETHIFTPNLVNQFAIGYTRFALDVTPLEYGLNLAAKLGLNGANTDPTSSAMTDISVSDLTEVGSGSLPERIPQNTWQINDTLAYVRGAHSLRFGFSVIRNNFSFLQLTEPAGFLDFSGVYTNNPLDGSGGDAIADFLLGLPDATQKSVFVKGIPHVSYTEFGAFIQDQWRVRPNLTLNLGLRYDLFTPPVEQHNRQSDFDLATGTIKPAGENGVSSGILNLRKNDFSPRIGFAYTVTSKTVVRGAYGLFFFNEQGTGGSARLFVANPFDAEGIDSCSSTTPCLNLQSGIPPISVLQTTPTAVYIPVANPTSNVQEWNLTVERELFRNTVVRAAYVGSKGTHLNIALDENVAFPGAGAVAPRRPYPNFSKISSWEAIGDSSYNALQLSAEKRYSHGIWFDAEYTWSKSLDNGGGGNSSDGDPRINIQNPRDVKADYGLSSFDYRQRLTLGHRLELPFGQGRRLLGGAKGVEQAFLGGWEFLGMLTLQAGAPTTPVLATPTANTGTFTRPNRICNGNLPPSQRNINRWFDASCFVNPPIYQFGDSGRNIIIGPGLETYDISLAKDFQITEKMGMTFRGEFFNLFNRPNFGLPDRNIGTPTSGTINSVITNARQIQFALRLHF